MFSKWVTQLWEVLKNFLQAFVCQPRYLQCYLGSYQSVKADGRTTRHLNRFLELKTHSNGHFWGSKPTHKGDLMWFSWKFLEQLAVFGGVFQLQPPVENFLDIITTWYGYVKLSTCIGLQVEYKIMIIRRLNRKLQADEHFWGGKKILSGVVL